MVGALDLTTLQWQKRYPNLVGAVSVVAQSLDYFVVGYVNGGFGVVSRSGRAVPPSFEDQPAKTARRLLFASGRVLIAGFETGQVSAWSLDSGAQLKTVTLHGQVAHLAEHADGRVIAASEFGQIAELDLSGLRASYCALMARVWRTVPTVWDSGRAQLEPPPPNHRCAVGL